MAPSGRPPRRPSRRPFRRPVRRPSLPGALLAAVAVALAGAVLLLLGVARATVWAPPSRTVAHVAGGDVPVVTTTDTALALDGPSVRIDVRGPADRTVFVGVGRADDVTAYLGGVARSELTAVRDGDPAIARAGSETSLPDPGGVDVWALSATGRGSASITWPQPPGRWRVVAAVDGSAAPTEVVLTWQRARASSSAPAFFAVGGLLLVLGGVGAWALRRAARARGVQGRPPDGATPDRAKGGDRPGPRRHDQSRHDQNRDDEDADVAPAPAPFRQPPTGTS